MPQRWKRQATLGLGEGGACSECAIRINVFCVWGISASLMRDARLRSRGCKRTRSGGSGFSGPLSADREIGPLLDFAVLHEEHADALPGERSRLRSESIDAVSD